MDDVSRTLKKCFKPFDVVTDSKKRVGFIQEVSISDCQEGFDDQVEYCVHFIVPNDGTEAWLTHKELKKHCNIFVEIAKIAAEGFGGNEEYVEKIMGLTTAST